MAKFPTMPTRLGAQIKIEVARRKITLQEATEIMGIPDRSYVSHIIVGYKPPGKYIVEIADFLGIPAEEVLALHYQPLIPEKKSKVS